MNKKMTIVVDSFDGYSDIWPSFFKVLNIYWPDCPYQIKLISNFKTYSGIDTIKTGEEINWSFRTLNAIKQIDSEYILLLLEDYLISSPIQNKKIKEALDFMINQKVKYLRLTNIPKSRFNIENRKIFPLYKDEEYAINLQASIWQKDFLIENLEKHPGNAWQFEIGLLRETKNKNHDEITGCFGCIDDPLHIKNGVLKGKWFPQTLKYFQNKNIKIEWEKRGKLSRYQALRYSFVFWIKSKISYSERKKLKCFLQKIGIKFVSDI